jgi:hypothetical protein
MPWLRRRTRSSAALFSRPFEEPHVYRGAVIAQSACGGDTSSQPEPLRIKVPQGLGRVQLLVQMTIDYQNDPG